MPDSLTKRRIDEPVLQALMSEAFGPEIGIATYRELGEGFFNAAFRILLSDGRDVVVKVSPPADASVLTYERDMMRAEAEFFQAAAATGVPQPTLLHAGFDRTVIDGDYVVLTSVDGVTWNSVRDELDAQQTAALRRDLGRYAAHLHTVRNPRGIFGYPAVPELSASTWPDAFAAMLGALLDDAERYNVALPVPSAQLRALVHRHADALAEVEVPALVHFDLWPGNVLITPPRTINGLIDGERVIWGDPLMEFIGIDVFGRADLDEALRGGYLEAGGHIADDDAAATRLTLYHLYMQLLLLIETAPRGYTDQGYLDRIFDECPKRVLAAVAQLG